MTRSGDTIDTPPDDDQFNSLFAAVSFPAGPASTPSSQAPRALFSEGKLNEAGESASTYFIVKAGDTFSVLCFLTSEDISHVCAGYISGDTSRFCIKPRTDSTLPNCCTTEKHKSYKFQICLKKCYIFKNQTSAFTSPEGDISELNPSQLLQLQKEKLPMAHWQQFFTFQHNAKIKSENKDVEDTKRKSSCWTRKSCCKHRLNAK